MDIPVEIRYKCIAEYKTSTDFEDELVEASWLDSSFKNRNAHLKKIVLKLDLRQLRLGNSDEEIKPFFSDEN